jgi:hypothetical protein
MLRQARIVLGRLLIAASSNSTKKDQRESISK